MQFQPDFHRKGAKDAKLPQRKQKNRGRMGTGVTLAAFPLPMVSCWRLTQKVSIHSVLAFLCVSFASFAPLRFRVNALSASRYAEKMPDTVGDSRRDGADEQLAHAGKPGSPGGEKAGDGADQEQRGAARRG